MTSHWIGQSQPPAMTAYMPLPLARCQAMADTRKIIEIKLDLHHKLHNRQKTY